jgi:2,4-dienoyl-CoA reductase-like NADH-dependent reductase (Old Yellow Enzyme family)
MGRIVHPSYLEGRAPVSASATTAPGSAHTYDGKQRYAEARPLGADEIPRLLEDYRQATRQALRAGFDGVQLHAANGYLIDQFLRESANLRTDEYGGSIENRIRLLDQVTRAIVEVAGADRTGVRLSPNGETQGVNDSDPDTLFTAAAARLQEIGIAFLELREQNSDGTFGHTDVPKVSPLIRKVFKAKLVLNSEYDAARAEEALRSGLADAISFGRPFLANPDLPRRYAEGLPLNEWNVKTWYSQGAEGYTDYPFAP